MWAIRLKPDAPYAVFDVSERLRIDGWQVPANTMPDDANDVAVIRVVVREGLSYDLAESRNGALREATEHLNKNPPQASTVRRGFSHT